MPEELWRSLRERLKIQVEYEIGESSQLPVSIKFTVTNSAHEALDTPRIVFENVILNVRGSDGLTSQELGTLAPQESATYEHRCSYDDLIDLDYYLDGSVSPEVFYTMHWAGKVSTDEAGIPPSAYIVVFNGMKIHQWLESTIQPFPIPGPNTTLGDMQILAASLEDTIMEIRATEERLSRLTHFILPRDRDTIYQHVNSVKAYIQSTIQGLSRMRQHLISPNPGQISAEVQHLVSSLENEAERVNAATQNLRDKFGVSP